LAFFSDLIWTRYRPETDLEGLIANTPFVVDYKK
jgi:hypothetical protein